jgi:phosphohistidine phosphatase
MKQLILVRHAKSEWGEEWLKDIDRPLSERGYRDAYILSEWFFKNHEIPKKLISSDATRALSTALIFARSFNYPANEIKVDPKIYECNVKTFKEIISQIENSLEYVMMFGHNPGITNLVNELNDGLDFDNIPTCGIISIQFDIKSWKDIHTKKGKINIQQFPKEFNK